MIDDIDELGRLADANLAASWTSLGSNAGGVIRASDGAVFVATGIPVAFFNGVFVTAPVSDPERVIAEAVSFMAERDVPWLIWVRDGVDDDLLAVGRGAGLSDAGGPLGMTLATIGDIPPPPSELEISAIVDGGAIETFRDVTARGFDMPRDVVDGFVTDSILDDPACTMLIGSVDGIAVSCSMVVVSGRTAGVYNVGTPAEHRRRGYGAALTWAAVEHGARRGCSHSTLQASELGAPVYRSMGFVEVGRYVQLEGPPSSGRHEPHA